MVQYDFTHLSANTSTVCYTNSLAQSQSPPQTSLISNGPQVQANSSMNKFGNFTQNAQTYPSSESYSTQQNVQAQLMNSQYQQQQNRQFQYQQSSPTKTYHHDTVQQQTGATPFQPHAPLQTNEPSFQSTPLAMNQSFQSQQNYSSHNFAFSSMPNAVNQSNLATLAMNPNFFRGFNGSSTPNSDNSKCG
jgi:hypothetical protein